MHDFVLSPRQFGFVVGTRAAGALGIGLLLANRIPESRRRRIGLTLVALGIATTVPAAKIVFGRRGSGQLPFQSGHEAEP
jgi:hypothetical protein